MFEPVFSFIEKLIEDFSWKRLIFVISLVFLLMTGLIVFESYTGYFRLAKINKSVDIIIKISSIPQDISQQSKETLASATKGISKDIDYFANGDSNPFSMNEGFVKVIAALFPWLLFSILLPFQAIDGTAKAIGGMIFLAIPSMVIAYYMPSFQRSWFNYIVYPFSYFFIAIFLVTFFQHKNKSST